MAAAPGPEKRSTRPATPAPTTPSTTPRATPPYVGRPLPPPPTAISGAVRTLTPRPGPGNPWPLFRYTLARILFARKTAFLLLLLALPALLAGIVNTGFGEEGLAGYARDGYLQGYGEPPPDASGGLLFFEDITFIILFPALIPIVTMSFAGATIREEADAKTLPYLFMRPIYRSWLVLPKSLAIILGVTLIAWVGLIVFWFASVSLSEPPFRNFDVLMGFLWAAFLLVAACVGVFTLCAALFKRAAILILIYIFVWETFTRLLPIGRIKAASLAHQATSIARAAADRTVPRLEDFFEEGFQAGVAHPGSAHVILIIAAVAGLLGAMYVVSVRDYDV